MSEPHPSATDTTTEESAMSTTEHAPAQVEDEQPYEDEQPHEDEQPYEDERWASEPLPRRPRRRLLTPVTALLFAVLVGAGGFIAGVQVEKGEVPASGAGRAGGGRLAALLAGRTGGAASRTGAVGFGGAGGATAGQVANVSGSNLFVTELEGNTIKVSASAAQITKQVTTSVRGVHPGDTVIVQGSRHSDGSIQATTVRDSGSSGAGGPIGFAGTGGSGSSTAPAGNNEPALFGR
jgi:hypothetical protein